MNPIEAIKTTTRPILKGIVIDTSTEGGSSSASKPKPTKGEGKGKEILIGKSKEEKQAEIKAEMERQRVIHNILRKRENDPHGMNKGDPRKHYSMKLSKLELRTIICMHLRRSQGKATLSPTLI